MTLIDSRRGILMLLAKLIKFLETLILMSEDISLTFSRNLSLLTFAKQQFCIVNCASAALSITLTDRSAYPTTLVPQLAGPVNDPARVLLPVLGVFSRSRSCLVFFGNWIVNISACLCSALNSSNVI